MSLQEHRRQYRPLTRKEKVAVRRRRQLHTENQRLQKLRDRIDEDHRVLTFAEWCGMNGFSVSTGRRILNGGTGPTVIQLSERRIGTTLQANRAWQEARARGVSDVAPHAKHDAAAQA
jgi:hypothetical protein